MPPDTEPEIATLAGSLGGIADRERMLLDDIATHPISTVTQRYERLGWNPKTGNGAKDKLLANGLATFEVLPVLNSRVKLLALTDQGAADLQARGVAVVSSGRAGLEHEFWRARIKERCESRGYKVTEEYHLGDGKRVDLLAQHNDRKILIEIETGKSDVHANISKCAGRGELVVFFTTMAAKDAARLPASVLALTPESLSQLHDLLR